MKLPITENDMWIKTYGNLYRKLMLTTGEIPIGLYKTIINEKPRCKRVSVIFLK